MFNFSNRNLKYCAGGISGTLGNYGRENTSCSSLLTGLLSGLAGITSVIYFHQRWQTSVGNDSNLLIVFYVQIMPDDFVMQLHRF